MMLICLIISFIAAGNHTTQAAFTPALLLYRLPRPQTHSSAVSSKTNKKPSSR